MDIKPTPRPSVEETVDKRITPEAVRSWVLHDQQQEQRQAEERADENERELVRQSFVKATGSNPTRRELETALEDLRTKRAREQAEVDAAQAARFYQQQF
jgi:hypothetical protein